jgi:hypothetical protein
MTWERFIEEALIAYKNRVDMKVYGGLPVQVSKAEYLRRLEKIKPDLTKHWNLHNAKA